MSELTPQPIDADDPGLTAYALGELEGAEAARYRAAVAASAELQAIVAEIQAEACLLTNELAREPQIPITAERREEIAAQASQSQPVAATQKRATRFSRGVVAVAASVALIPGTWCAFQAAFPRLQRSPVLARQESLASSSEYYLGDDVQYFPASPEQLSKITAWKNQSQTQQRKSDEHGGLAYSNSPDVSPSVAKPATAVSSDARTKLESLGYVAGGQGSTLTSKEAQVPGLRTRRKYIDHNPSAVTPLPAEPQERLRFGVNEKADAYLGVPNLDVFPPTSRVEGQKGVYPPGASVAGVPILNKVPYVSRADGKKASQSESAPDKLSLAWRKPNLPWYDAPAADPNANPTVVTTTKSKGVLLLADENKRARAPESKAKPDTFDFTDESLDDVREKILEREAKAKLLEKQKQTDPTTDEAYNPIYENAFITPQEQQLSTFSIDVDTASYANLRRFVQGGQLPPPDAVRIEELVNYFSYQYPQPQDGRPFSVQTDIAACPWQPGHQLVRIGLKGKEIPKEQRSPTNLVFLVDVSGSMQAQNKLPLVRESLKTLVNQLDERDKVAIVTYAGEAGVRLPSTSVAQKEVVLSAIDGLGAGGSTNGAAGINTAYDIAAQEFLEKGTNRVILCTDGDFNVGVTSDDALVKMIQTRAKGGVFLSVFGFGMGNLKDAKLEQLADKGNGQYGYIDDQQEANKVFVQELMGTLVTIAKDVKIQIDFNKDTVASYRLVGYENRIMAAEDFHDDKKDAGEIGAGHTVTALYQIVPIKDLKANEETRWLTVKLRYKQPDAATSVLMENPLVGQPGQLKLAPSDFQFAASVAACGLLLRHSQHAGQANWSLVKELAQSGLSHDPYGHRRAFIGLAAQAESLMGQFYPKPVPATDSTAGGKYKSLLRRVHAPKDAEKFGQFKDQGHSDKKAYAGAENLPEGYWVYAAPYWYIWAETTAKPNGPAF